MLPTQQPARSAGALLTGVVDASDAAQWRLVALLWLLAGSLGLAMTALGLDPEAQDGIIAALGVLALVAGGVQLVLADRLPTRWIGPTLVGATLAAAGAALAAGEADSPFVLLFAWFGAEAWYFLSYRGAVAFTTYAVVLSGVVAVAAPGAEGDAASWWLMTAGTLLAVGVVSSALRIRSDRLVTRLRAAALRDELTGLLNRRGHRERLDEELVRARRHGTALSVVLGDLDDFKALNDRFGHRAGDEALQRFAAICDEHLRAVDFIGRVGGEEFAIVLPGAGGDEAQAAAERLRLAIRAELRDPGGRAVTASFGVASHPRDGTASEVLLDRADEAMYAAKARGRDRTVRFGPGLEREAPPGR